MKNGNRILGSGKRILLAALMVFLLAGCGKTAVETTTIAIQKDGSIEHTVVEESGEMSADLLKSMIEEKMEAYNDSNSGAGDVTLDSVELKEGVVKVVMTYPDAASFEGFMNMDVVEVDPALRAPFFYGTVEEAYMQGFDLDVALQGAEKDGTLQGKNDILAKSDSKIIIYDNEMNLGAAVQIRLRKKPLYISDNVTVAGRKLVEISGTGAPAYILLEN